MLEKFDAQSGILYSAGSDTPLFGTRAYTSPLLGVSLPLPPIQYLEPLSEPNVRPGLVPYDTVSEPAWENVLCILGATRGVRGVASETFSDAYSYIAPGHGD